MKRIGALIILVTSFHGLAAQSPATLTPAVPSALPPVLAGPSKVFAGSPELLQESGAGEGPVWHAELGLLTSGDGNINRRDKQGKSSVYRQNAGSNGLLFDRQGRLIVCEAARRRVTRIEPDDQLVVLAETYDGKKFNQPNDLTIDSKGRIYFSDPRYGARDDMQIVDQAGQTIEGVYRIDPDGRVTRVLGREVDRANGLIVTADDKFMFVADNNNSQGGARKLHRFDMNADGTLKLDTKKTIYDWGTTRGPDGMKLDSAGNLYVAAGLNIAHLPDETAEKPTAGIYVFSPAGELIDFAKIPRDETTNCAFGGDDFKTLYVTAGGSLWSIRTKFAGKQ